MDEFRTNPVESVILHAAETPKGKSDPDSTSAADDVQPMSCWHQFMRLVCYPVNLVFAFIKLFYFSFMAGLGSILPYLSLYYKQMGLSPQQIGVISGLRPIVGFLSGPVWGALGDRFNIRKLLLMISIISWMAIFIGIAFVPEPGDADDCPAEFEPYRKVGTLEEGSHQTKIVLTTANNGTQTVSEAEYNILKESIGWIYESEGLHRVFITILMLIVLGEFFQSPTTALSDAGTIQTLGRDNLDYYGSQRAWGPIGFAAGSLAVGALVASTRKLENICGVELYFTDYTSFVYVFSAFMVVSFICATRFSFSDPRDKNPEKVELTQAAASAKTEKPGSESIGDSPDYSTVAVLKVFTNVHYGSWLGTAFYVGVCNGVIWGFLYWHLENLGADQFMIGVASGVNCFSEFVMFFFVHYVIRWIGHMGVMYLGLAFYAIRFGVYAAISNPWWVLPAELVQGITFSCVWVSLTAYSTLAVPSVSLGTVQGIMHGIYFGLGNGSGHLIGGILIDVLGASITFVIMSATTVVILLMFFVAQHFSSKPREDYEQFDDSKEVVPEKSNIDSADTSESTQ